MNLRSEIVRLKAAIATLGLLLRRTRDERYVTATYSFHGIEDELSALQLELQGVTQDLESKGGPSWLKL